MYRQIDVDCQTKMNPPHCADCIFSKNCATRVKNDAKKKEIGVVEINSESVAVWKKWKIRKSLAT